MAIARKFGDKVHKWHVPDLQTAAVGLPVQETSTDRFNLDVDAWFGEACTPTIANVIHHMKYIQSADLNNPILLSAEGHVFDGLHRLAKCMLSPDFSPGFEARPPRWFWLRGLRLRTPQAYPLRYVEESEGA